MDLANTKRARVRDSEEEEEEEQEGGDREDRRNRGDKGQRGKGKKQGKAGQGRYVLVPAIALFFWLILWVGKAPPGCLGVCLDLFLFYFLLYFNSSYILFISIHECYLDFFFPFVLIFLIRYSFWFI